MAQKGTDQEYLLKDQYQDGSNLNARVELHRRFSTNQHGWFDWVIDQFDFPAQCRILELGCGPGWLWRNTIGRIPADWDVTLSDFSPGMVEEAQQGLADSEHPFRFEVIDVQDIPFDDAPFDVVIANHMLYHVPDRAKALAEIKRVLKPGGRFFAATVGDNHMRQIPELLNRFDARLETLDDYQIPEFTLQTAAPELESLFPGAECRWYEDGLHVTEVESLVAYILSGIRIDQTVLAGRVEEFRVFIAQEMAANDGVIRISKETGMFVMRNR